MVATRSPRGVVIAIAGLAWCAAACSKSPPPADTTVPSPDSEAPAPATPDTAEATADTEPQPGPDGASAAQEGAMQYWSADVHVGAITLEMGITLTVADGTWSGKLDIPAQKAHGLALDEVALDGNQLAFTLKPPGAPEAAWARFAITVAADGQSGEGAMTQAGQIFPASLKRHTSPEGLPRLSARPQLPQPPFPYHAEEVSYPNPADGATIGGTLTVPGGDGPHPAVLLITGSGAQDRDETVFGHKPFLVLADHLTRAGVAVLRVDDRGVGASKGGTANATVELHATDAAAGVAFLRGRADIDGARVGVIGHSEGGLIAALVAAADPKLAAVVSLAGTGVDGVTLLTWQAKVNLEKGTTASPEAVATLTELQRQTMEAVKRGAPPEELVALLTQAITFAQANVPEAGLGRVLTGAEIAQQAATQAKAELQHPWVQSFVKLDPAPHWRQVKCPVLALNGELDTQVDAETNLPAIAAALAAGGNQDVTTKAMPSLNHLFQPATTGLVDEYARIETTLAPALLETVSDWLTARMKR